MQRCTTPRLQIQRKKVGMGVLMYLDIVIVLPTWYKINTFVAYLPHQKIAKMEALEHQILELPYHQGKGHAQFIA